MSPLVTRPIASPDTTEQKTRWPGHRILIVTGARALCDTPAAVNWARGIIEFAVLGMGANSVVVAGDANGPDAWATLSASAAGQCWERWRLDGGVAFTRGTSPLAGIESWCDLTLVPERNSPARKTWPLERNKAMMKAYRNRIDVDVLALHAPWSRTRGTAHTVAHIVGGWHVDLCERTCPAAFGPVTP